jgi:hypothetical protein
MNLKSFRFFQSSWFSFENFWEQILNLKFVIKIL